MATKAKLTPWFPAGVRPARKGVYLRDGYGFTAYQYWNGDFWVYGESTAKGAARWAQSHPDHVCVLQDRWRGLASDPSAA